MHKWHTLLSHIICRIRRSWRSVWTNLALRGLVLPPAVSLIVQSRGAAACSAQAPFLKAKCSGHFFLLPWTKHASQQPTICPKVVLEATVNWHCDQRKFQPHPSQFGLLPLQIAVSSSTLFVLGLPCESSSNARFLLPALYKSA